MSEYGGIEFEIPLIPTEEQLRQMRKEQIRERQKVFEGRAEERKAFEIILRNIDPENIYLKHGYKSLWPCNIYLINQGKFNKEDDPIKIKDHLISGNKIIVVSEDFVDVLSRWEVRYIDGPVAINDPNNQYYSVTQAAILCGKGERTIRRDFKDTIEELRGLIPRSGLIFCYGILKTIALNQRKQTRTTVKDYRRTGDKYQELMSPEHVIQEIKDFKNWLHEQGK